MAAVVFEDLSGTATPVSPNDNLYQPLIEASNNDPVFRMRMISLQDANSNADTTTSAIYNPPHHQK
jgi:hypothetical protein